MTTLNWQDYFNPGVVPGVSVPTRTTTTTNPTAPTISNVSNLLSSRGGLISRSGGSSQSKSSSPTTSGIISLELPTTSNNSSSTPTVDLKPKGWGNVLNVYLAPLRGQPIAVGGKTIPVISPALSVVTGVAEIGSIAYGAAAALGASSAGAAAAGSAYTATGSVGGSSLTPYLIGAGAGAVGALLLSGKQPQNQNVTPSQNTSPILTPTQTITPTIAPTTQTNPYLNVPGSYNNINQSTNSMTYNYSNQLTESYQISNQTTTSSQTTTAAQTGSPDLLVPLLIGAAIFLLGGNKN